MGNFRRKMSPKEAIGPKAYVPFTQSDKLWGCEKAKWLRLRAVNCGQGLGVIWKD